MLAEANRSLGRQPTRPQHDRGDPAVDPSLGEGLGGDGDPQPKASGNPGCGLDAKP